ncbi:hypothetical protein LCGC14_3075200 [marine sediment metagenome]|uniref:DUF7352 domain-containing protein n=1 Tax=marine sediment metagenome TaxID=412755 RepID=A0A0F8WEY8_9ZZZZ
MIIYKYNVPIEVSFFDLALPLGAEILAFQTQDGLPKLWVLVDPEYIHEVTRHFTIRGTGDFFDYKKADSYIGTIQMSSYVWHLFETKE